MTVLGCPRCHRFISVSIIPGGNPVAHEDPTRWTSRYRSCERCGYVLCEDCWSKSSHHECRVAGLEERVECVEAFVRFYRQDQVSGTEVLSVIQGALMTPGAHPEWIGPILQDVPDEFLGKLRAFCEGIQHVDEVLHFGPPGPTWQQDLLESLKLWFASR